MGTVFVVSRRDFLVNLAASLALLFAPIERFFERLRELLGTVAARADEVDPLTFERLARCLAETYEPALRREWNRTSPLIDSFWCAGLFPR